MKKIGYLLMTLFFANIAFAGSNFNYIPVGNTTGPGTYTVSTTTAPASSTVIRRPTSSAVQTLTPLLLGISMIALDPYVINVNGVNYYMVKDHGYEKWDIADVLGLGDKPDEMFMSLQKLDFDGDETKLTAQELAYNRIRFVAQHKKGYLELKHPEKDFPLDKIEYIDLKSLRIAEDEAMDNDGIYGYFDVVIKNDDGSTKTIVGDLTFDHATDIKKLMKKAK